MLTDQQTRFGHLGLEAVVVLGIDPVQGGAKHGHRHAARGQAALMNGPIDPLGQATHHRPARPRQG